MSNMKLIVGLGNPGKEYADTRHNVGWDAVALAAGEVKFTNKPEFKAEIAQGTEKTLFVHPLTFMNLSGEAVGALQRYYKIAAEDILVVQDEMDLSAGQLRFSRQAGAAGHKGVTSIQEALGSNDFTRLRVGIGRPPEKMEATDYVLGKRGRDFDLQPAAEAIKDWLVLSTVEVMNKWNRS
jgi:peptidyl-tRNA hydrolase, PTH1 family